MHLEAQTGPGQADGPFQAVFYWNYACVKATGLDVLQNVLEVAEVD
jgi:hypothetical protein